MVNQAQNAESKAQQDMTVTTVQLHSPAGKVLDELLVKVGESDVTAFAELYELVAARVFGTIVRALRDRSQAEEVSQEVFVEIWRRAARFDRTRGTAMSWILAIAHARSVDRVRSSQSSRERDTNYAVNNVVRDTDVVLEAVISSHNRASVISAMATLTAPQRECLHLAFYGGKTQREIAEILALPLGTIKTRTRAALARLRANLAATGAFDMRSFAG